MMGSCRTGITSPSWTSASRSLRERIRGLGGEEPAQREARLDCLIPGGGGGCGPLRLGGPGRRSGRRRPGAQRLRRLLSPEEGQKGQPGAEARRGQERPAGGDRLGRAPGNHPVGDAQGRATLRGTGARPGPNGLTETVGIHWAELEGFVPEVGGHNPAWVNEVHEKGLHSAVSKGRTRTEYLLPPERDDREAGLWSGAFYSQ
jgi:hypothetical protein